MSATTTRNAADVLRHMSVIERLVADIVEIASQGWGNKQYPILFTQIREMNANPDQYIGLDRAELMERLISTTFPTEDTTLIARTIQRKYGI